ncbi:MAG: ATP-grasp domain-containing protein [Bacteroidota bacterium]
MILIFPIEIKYKAEIVGAQRQGFQTFYYSYEHIVLGDVRSMLGQIPICTHPTPALLRGFVMPLVAYTAIYEQLANEKNIYLLDTPEQHLEVCSVVNHYDKVSHLCPPTAWIDGESALDEEVLKAKLSTFGKQGKRLMMKDYMRSAKYEREQPYDIADHTQISQVHEAMAKFKAYHNGVINGGFVFSEFIPDLCLVHDQPFPLTHQPMYEEYRLLFFNKDLLMVVNYWEEMPDYSHQLQKDELKPFQEAAKHINSNFFTIDIARRKDGSLVLIELNPGQLSGVDYKRHHEFYQLLQQYLHTLSEDTIISQV